jgi:hypothetical protein
MELVLEAAAHNKSAETRAKKQNFMVVGVGEDETAAANVAKNSHRAISNFSCRNISTFRLGLLSSDV